VTFALGFLVAFRSSFLKFLQTHRAASPLSDIMHSHNSSSLKAGCNTYNIRDNIKPLQNFQTTQDAPSPRGNSNYWLEILKKNLKVLESYFMEVAQILSTHERSSESTVVV